MTRALRTRTFGQDLVGDKVEFNGLLIALNEMYRDIREIITAPSSVNEAVDVELVGGKFPISIALTSPKIPLGVVALRIVLDAPGLPAASSPVDVPSDLIGKWNETDTSQFTLLQSTTGLTSSLTTATRDGRTVLRANLAGSYAGVHGFGAWRFADADMPSRYRVRMSVYRSVDNGGGDYLRAGPLVCASGTGTGLRGIAACGGSDTTNASLYYGINAGVISLATPGNGGSGCWLDTDTKTIFDYVVDCVSPATATPNYNIAFSGLSTLSATGIEGDVTSQIQQTSGFSGWSGLVLNTVGVAFVCATPVGLSDNTIDFADFEVLKHPMDISEGATVEATSATLVDQLAPVTVDWTLGAGNQLVIRGVSGLETGKRYKARLLIVRE